MISKFQDDIKILLLYKVGTLVTNEAFEYLSLSKTSTSNENTSAMIHFIQK